MKGRWLRFARGEKWGFWTTRALSRALGRLDKRLHFLIETREVAADGVLRSLRPLELHGGLTRQLFEPSKHFFSPGEQMVPLVQVREPRFQVLAKIRHAIGFGQGRFDHAASSSRDAGDRLPPLPPGQTPSEGHQGADFFRLVG